MNCRMLPLLLGAGLAAGCGRPGSDEEVGVGRRVGSVAGPDRAPEEDTAPAPPLVGGCHVTVRAARSGIPADGHTAVPLSLVGTDDAGRPLPDGTVIGVVASSGQVAGETALRAGIAAAELRASSWPGDIQLTAPRCQVGMAAPLRFEPLQAVSAQLHLHGSLSEGTGTMREFNADAAAAGLDLLWWTDHDFIFREHPELDLETIDWENGTAEGELPGTMATGSIPWSMVDRGGTLGGASLSVLAEAAAEGSYGARVEVGEVPAGGEHHRSWGLSVRQIWQQRPTLAGLQLSFRVRRNAMAGTATFAVVANLSGAGEGGRAIHFYDGLADSSAGSDELWVPMGARTGEWVEVVVDVSALADATWPEQERDLSTSMFTLALSAEEGAEGSWDIDSVEFRQALRGQALLDAQRGFLAELEGAGGPANLVGQEITGLAEGHLNAFGSNVPLPDYPGLTGGLDELVAVAHAHGGIVAFNHLFGVGGTLADEAIRAEQVETTLAELLATEAHGCDLLEVGYRERVGQISDFLQVWDGLALEGQLLTGIGSSDIHGRGEWGEAPNNFITWVAAGSDDEADLLHGLRRGAAWFGDPTLFPDGEVQVSFEAPELHASTGQVLVGAAGPVHMRFAADWLDATWTVRVIADGELLAEVPVGETGPFATDFTVNAEGLRLVRVEVVGPEAYPVLYTNPIYFFEEGAGLDPDRLPVP